MSKNYYGQRNRDNFKSQHIKSNTYVAHAPYNFVPLNNSVIGADPILPQDRYYPDRYSGYIDCELETLTPIYIRAGLTEDELKKHIGTKELLFCWEKIPGSDEEKLKKYLKHAFDASWIENAVIKKIDDGMTIRVFLENKSISIVYSIENNNVIIKTDDGKIEELFVGFEKSVHNIYARDKSDFFSPGGQERIPGSSLRGMIRNLVEIVSWSKFEFFENKNLYYRGFADKSSLSREYNTKMNPRDAKTGRSNYNMYAGYLKMEGFKYFIYPAIEGQFEQITKQKAMQFVKDIGKNYSEFKYYKLNDGKHIIVSGQIPGKKKEWLIYRKDTIIENRIEIPEVDIWNYQNDENRNNKVPDLIRLCEKEDVPCFYVRWNDAQGKSRVSFGHTGLFRLAYNKSVKEHLPLIHDSDILDFANVIFGTQTKGKESHLFCWDEIPGKDNDKLREILTKINEKLDRNAKIEKVDDGKTIRILDGNNSYTFKLNPKESRVRLNFNDDLVTEFTVKKENHQKNICTDSFAGRVFFEDAKLTDPKKKAILDEAIPKTLLGPKPTSFQLYLEQDTTDIKKLKHYNSETHIRGNKFYWHKSGENWKKDDQDPKKFNPKIETKIKPVENEKGTKFKFRIRFENLSRHELGAILFALKLPEGCAHKIGMGKPIGLGSVSINPALFIIKRNERYSTLFDDSGWVMGKNKKNENEVDKIIEDFGNLMRDKINIMENRNYTSIWDTDRLKQLKILLNFEKGKNLEKDGQIDYMKLDDVTKGLRNRDVLPDAIDV